MSETPAPTGAVAHPELLAVYLNDHIASAAGGIELVTRMIGAHRGSTHEDGLRQLLDELRQEKSDLERTARALGLPILPGDHPVGTRGRHRRLRRLQLLHELSLLNGFVASTSRRESRTSRHTSVWWSTRDPRRRTARSIRQATSSSELRAASTTSQNQITPHGGAPTPGITRPSASHL